MANRRRAFERTLADADDGVMPFASPGVLDNEDSNPDFDLSQSAGPATKAARRSTSRKSKKKSSRRKAGDLI